MRDIYTIECRAGTGRAARERGGPFPWIGVGQMPSSDVANITFEPFANE